MALERRRHRAHRPSDTLRFRQEGSGSPQPSQNGGVIGWIEFQQGSQTALRVGCSSGRWQAAQPGATIAATSASII
jgi:hypothetical protein